MRHTRTALAVAGAAVIGMGAAALPAAAKDGPRGERGAKAGKTVKADRDQGVRRRGFRGCNIAEDQLLTADTHPGLAKLEKRLNSLVADEKITERRAERILDRRTKQVTIRVTVRDARWAPVFELFGATGDTFKARKLALRDLRKEAGGIRALLEDKDLKISDLRAARREGRIAGRTARRDLCRSGDEPELTPSAPATEDPATSA